MSDRGSLGMGRRRGYARGFTLVEMLIAMAVTLIILATLANIFSWLTDSVNDSRSTIGMTSRLRHTRNQLQLDLIGITSPMLPPLRPEAGYGFFEYAEGPSQDSNSVGLPLTLGSTLVPTTALGDADDVLMFTTRSRGEPFVGIGPGGPIQSKVAEIVWHAVENPLDGSQGEPGFYTLYRRTFLVIPTSYSEVRPGWTAAQLLTRLAHLQSLYDISLRIDWANQQIVSNTLADLTKPESRADHIGPLYPFPLAYVGFGYSSGPSVAFSNCPGYTGSGAAATTRIVNGQVRVFEITNPGSGYNHKPVVILSGGGGSGAYGRARVNSDGEVIGIVAGPVPLDGNRVGEDVMLTNVLAFDVRAFDPLAPLYQHPTGSVVQPGDQGWRDIFTAGGTPTVVGQGAYVDLGYLGGAWNPSTSVSVFSNNGIDASIPAFASLYLRTYDTGSYHYEHDGIDQDNDTLPDQGTDGFDNNNSYGVDDASERETSPPYPVPLRGIQIKIRVYEPDSRAVREVTVLQSFVPE